jgi:hypothetical protein
MSVSDQWNDILELEENILWQGQPVSGFTPTFFGFFNLLLGGFFAVIVLGFMAMLGSDLINNDITEPTGTIISYWLFLFSVLAICLGMIASAVFWPEYKQKRTWYMLTNKHAYIATVLPIIGKRFKSYPIQNCKTLELKDGPLQSVFFAEETWDDDDGSVLTEQIGFERIKYGHEVYRLLRRIQAPTSERKDYT